MEAQITLAGNVGGDVRHRTVEGYGGVASFNLATTPRVRRDGSWVDGETTWFRVTCWRQLAERVRDSLRRGDAVVVVGRLRTERWTDELGNRRAGLLIEAVTVGPDLRRGVAHFNRAGRGADDEAPRMESAAEAELAALEASAEEAADVEESVVEMSEVKVA